MVGYHGHRFQNFAQSQEFLQVSVRGSLREEKGEEGACGEVLEILDIRLYRQSGLSYLPPPLFLSCLTGEKEDGQHQELRFVEGEDRTSTERPHDKNLKKGKGKGVRFEGLSQFKSTVFDGRCNVAFYLFIYLFLFIFLKKDTFLTEKNMSDFVD